MQSNVRVSRACLDWVRRLTDAAAAQGQRASGSVSSDNDGGCQDASQGCLARWRTASTAGGHKCAGRDADEIGRLTRTHEQRVGQQSRWGPSSCHSGQLTRRQAGVEAAGRRVGDVVLQRQQRLSWQLAKAKQEGSQTTRYAPRSSTHWARVWMWSGQCRRLSRRWCR